jgi:hypothetical protein
VSTLYALHGITDPATDRREEIGDVGVLIDNLGFEGVWAPDAEVHVSFTSKTAAARLLDKMARSLG